MEEIRRIRRIRAFRRNSFFKQIWKIEFLLFVRVSPFSFFFLTKYFTELWITDEFHFLSCSLSLSLCVKSTQKLSRQNNRNAIYLIEKKFEIEIKQWIYIYIKNIKLKIYETWRKINRFLSGNNFFESTNRRQKWPIRDWLIATTRD